MKYQHAEAFALMWYGCKTCGHLERIWNSRDGVTPFGDVCPSCGMLTQHIEWHRDVCQPNHRLNPGQRYWADMTMEHAMMLAKRMIATNPRKNRPKAEDLAKHYYADGKTPTLMIFGYKREVAASMPQNKEP